MSSYASLIHPLILLFASLYRVALLLLLQVSSGVFDLFDSLLLLSKGRMAYTGASCKAVSYFTDTPTLSFSSAGYVNPADFLLDISGCMIPNANVIAAAYIVYL